MFKILENLLDDLQDWWYEDFRSIKVYMEQYREQIKSLTKVFSLIITLALLTLFFLVLGLAFLGVISIMSILIVIELFRKRINVFN